jgi:hypothetical protein
VNPVPNPDPNPNQAPQMSLKDRCAREPSWSAFWLQKPSILRACVREEDAGGGEAGAHSTTPTYTVRRDSPAREPSWSAFWLQKPSILRACVREEVPDWDSSKFIRDLCSFIHR